MKYIKPQYYDTFECAAGACPDTCCAGWQIMIDEDSLEKYSQVSGAFGNRLYRSIDWEEGAFKQKKGRCAFLNEKDLCDLYTALGKDALCNTCRMYPRHVEEFDGLREMSLSLSCPIAAKMILTCKEGLELIEEEDDEPEELAEEFEEFDTLLFSQLQDARNVMFRLLSRREVSIEHRMAQIIQTAREMQVCIDEARYFEIDDVIRKLEERMETIKELTEGGEPDFHKVCTEFQILCDLERLRPEWSEVLHSTWECLLARGETAYEQLMDDFEKAYGDESLYGEAWSIFTENLFGFFLLTYFCGAVYDDWIYSKAALAWFSVRWIRNIICADWALGRFDEESYWEHWIQVAYRYAREIEHSDENLNMLEEQLQPEEE